jgi:hypothetical protein
LLAPILGADPCVVLQRAHFPLVCVENLDRLDRQSTAAGGLDAVCHCFAHMT